MTSRDAILNAVRSGRPAEVAAPKIPSFSRNDGSLVHQFIEAMESVSGRVVEVGTPPGTANESRYATVSEALYACYPEANAVASTRPEWSEDAVVVHNAFDSDMLTSVDLCVCSAELGVAENGSVWLTALGHPAAPFGASNLAVVLDRQNIVPDMHAAYRKIKPAESDYAAFVSGPSKTADIEQSLVIGAHGPKTLTVVLV